jgi:hypothetical protein
MNRNLLPFENQDLVATKDIFVFTDYPIIALGDKSGELAQVRKVKLLSYDWNKYCQIEVNGKVFEVKSGYLYKNHGRCGDTATANPIRLMLSNKDYALLNHAKRKFGVKYEITEENNNGVEKKTLYPTLKKALSKLHKSQHLLFSESKNITCIYLSKVGRTEDTLMVMMDDGVTTFIDKNGRSVIKNRHLNRY